MPKYTRSSGEQVEVADMNPAHLRSAFYKLAREEPDHEELPGMKAQVRANLVKWRAELVVAQASATGEEATTLAEKITKADEELQALSEGDDA